MKRPCLLGAVVAGIVLAAGVGFGPGSAVGESGEEKGLVLRGEELEGGLRIDEVFYETAEGRTALPVEGAVSGGGGPVEMEWKRGVGPAVRVAVVTRGNAFTVRMEGEADAGITGWGVSIEAREGERFTGRWSGWWTGRRRRPGPGPLVAEHALEAAYYDGTPVTGPFNSQVMEDVLRRL